MTDLEDDMDMDIILSIRTEADADRFVADILAEGLPAPPVLKPMAVRAMVGGDAPAMDPRVYDLLQLIDSLHDFAERPPRDPEYLRKSLRVELPIITKVRPTRPSPFREKMKLEEMFGPFGGKRKTNYIIEDLTSNKEFQFSEGKPVPNPLFGKNFEQGMEPFADAAAEGFAHAEIRCFDESGFKILKVMNLVSVVSSIRSYFGKDASFVVDESIPMTRLILATNLIWKSFLKNTRVEGFAFDSREIVNWWKVWMELSTTWKCYTCDAGLMDADEHVFPLDPRPTEEVFRKDALVQIRLYDAALKDSEYVDDAQLADEHERLKAKVPTFTYDIQTSPGCPIHLDDLTVDQDTQWVVAEPYEGLYSSDAMAQRIVAIKALKLDAAVPMAQKRAGDWGQVEHCGKYGMVFVTADKTAMLYAIARGVMTLYVRTWQRETVLKDYEKADIFRHSFVMFGAGGQVGGAKGTRHQYQRCDLLARWGCTPTALSTCTSAGNLTPSILDPA